MTEFIFYSVDFIIGVILKQRRGVFISLVTTRACISVYFVIISLSTELFLIKTARNSIVLLLFIMVGSAFQSSKSYTILAA